MDPALRHHGDETDSEADAHGSATNEHEVAAAHAVHVQAHEVASVVNGAAAAIQAAAAVAAASAWATAAATAANTNTSEGSLDMDGKSGSSKMRRAAWNQDEENKLTELANRYANAGQRMCWRLIAQELGTGRTSKQCREHYLNSLRPNMKKGQWTQREEYIIAREHAKIGSHWCIIAKKLPGRTDNSIKNFYNATVRSKAVNKHESFLWLYVDKVHRCGMESKQALQVATEIWTSAVPPSVAQEVLHGVQEDGAEALMLLSGKRKDLAALMADDGKRQKLDGGMLSPASAAAAIAAAAGPHDRQRQELLQTLGIVGGGHALTMQQQQLAQNGQLDVTLLQQQLLLQQLVNAAGGGNGQAMNNAGGHQSNILSMLQLLSQQQQQQQQGGQASLMQQMGMGSAGTPTGGANSLLSLLGVQDGGGQMQPADAAAAVAAAAAAASGAGQGMTHIELHDVKQEGDHSMSDPAMLEAAAAAAAASAAAQAHGHGHDQHSMHGQVHGHMVGDQQHMNAAALQALGEQFPGLQGLQGNVPVEVLLASLPAGQH